MKEEKSNYNVIFINFGEKDESQKEQYLSEPTNQAFDFKELKKTAFETEAIAVVIKLYNKLMKELGFELIFNPDISRIHTINKKEYDEKTGVKGSIGKHSRGHIYLCRCFKWRFVSALIHELAHLLSYYEISVTNENDKLNSIRWKQSGISINGKNSKPDRFRGLNEAITERLARQIRFDFVKESSLLNEKEGKRMLQNGGYYDQINILNKILELNGISNTEGIRPFLQSYVFGDRDFIKKIPFSKRQIVMLSKVEEEKNAEDFLDSL